MTAPLAMENDWLINWVLKINNREVVVGTELKISGESGRFRFLRHVQGGPNGGWIDVYGGRPGHETIRSFRLDRIKTVHRTRRMYQKP